MKSIPTLLLALFLQAACTTTPVSSTAPNTQPESKPGAVVSELAKTTQSWNGAKLPEYSKGQPKVTILRIKIPAGTQLDTHHHPVINAGVLLSGQLTVVAKDGQKLQLKAGDPIVELVNTAHYGINEGSTPAEIIVFYAGTDELPITVVEPKQDKRLQ